MKNKNQNSYDYPDISGIFDIDESSLPKELMAKEKTKKDRHRQSILISEDREKRMEKEREKELKTAQKTQKQQAQKKAKIKRIFRLSLIAALLMLIAVFGIKTAISNKNAVEVTVSQGTLGEISNSYITKAVMLRSSDSTLCAVFIDNDFDLHSVATQLEANIVSADGRSFTATVGSIVNAPVNDSVAAKIISCLPDSLFSYASNYLIYVKPSQNMTGIAENDIVSVEIIIQQAKDTLIIPSSAVFEDENGTFVWKYSSFTKKLTKTYVETGIKNSLSTQILGGLSEKTQIVSSIISETAELSENIKIKITE